MTSVASDLSAALDAESGAPARDLRPRRVQPHLPAVCRRRWLTAATASNRPNSLPPGLLPRRAAAPAARRAAERGRPEGWSTRRRRDRGRGFGGPPPGLPPPDRDRPPDAWRGGRPERGDRGGPPEPGDGQGPRGRVARRPAARIGKRADHRRRPRPLGFVVIPINPPPVFVALRELGPTLTWVGLMLLAIGAASAALLDLRSGAPPAADARTGRARARRRANRRARGRSRRRRSQRAGARIQPDGRRSRRARRGAGGLGQARGGNCWQTSHTS